MLNPKRTLPVMIALAVLAHAPASSQTTTLPELELRQIMRQLTSDMQTVVEAIAREDWTLVAATAPKIANHREPQPAEKMKILAFIGDKLVDFKGLDELAHQAGLAMEQAAKQRDGKAVVAAFGAIQSACLSCHETYREPFLTHFYGKR